MRYATTPVAIDNIADGVRVRLRHETEDQDGNKNVTETEEEFDLLVGADGLRSTVRKLTFGHMNILGAP